MAEESSTAQQDSKTVSPSQTDDASSHETHGEEHAATPVETAPLDTLFDRDQMAGFDRDDALAGSHIGKMLALFFLYTVIVMSLVALWTYNATSN